MIKTYVKRPVEIRAIQWTEDNLKEIWEFMGDTALSCYSCGNRCGNGEIELCIDTLEGVMYAAPGDYIIRGVKGEFYPCKPDIFEETYEEVGGEVNVITKET